MDEIFFSYAKEDKDSISDIFKSFKSSGLNPWMDDPPSPFHFDGIPIGQDWDNYIRNKLKESKIILAFLSKKSIAKQGYVQKEYRLALSIQMNKPIEQYNLFPVLLEDCPIPNIRVDTMHLEQLQWYKLYEKGVDGLIAEIKKRIGLASTESDDLESLYYKNQINYLKWLNSDTVEMMEKKIAKLEEELSKTENRYIDLQSETENRKMYDIFENKRRDGFF